MAHHAAGNSPENSENTTMARKAMARQARADAGPRLKQTASQIAALSGAEHLIKGPHLDLGQDGDSILASYPHQPFEVHHKLVGHPLLQLEEIWKLSERVPANHTDWHRTVPIDHEGRPPKSDLSKRETFEQLETSDSWFGIDDVEVDPLYQAFMNEIIDEIQGFMGWSSEGMHQRECNIFVSSGGSGKPFHIDPEHNFLLQVQGTKTVYMWDAADRDLLPETVYEALCTTTNWAGLKINSGGRPASHEFELVPGNGCYFPVQWPHAVKNGSNGVSVSLSVTYRSKYSRRKETVHQYNAKVRGRGKQPRNYGETPIVDASKVAVMQTGRAIKRALGK